MDFLFGAETPLAVRFFIAFVIVLGLIGGTAYLVRRFGGERLAAAGRGRQPRLAVVDAAAVDGRRRLILIRRDNIEHLLLIGGPTDVVVEPNILRGATVPRDAAPPRQPAAAETLPRAVPLGEGTMWPLQPQAEPTLTPPAPPPPPRQQRPPVAEEPPQWHPEPEPIAPPPPAPPPQRPARQADPLAGLAAELARTAPQAEAAARRPARTPVQPRLQARENIAAPIHEDPSDTAREPAAETPFASPADQNLAEMAQRLEAALRRPAKRPDDMRIAEPQPTQAAADPKPIRNEVRPMRSEAPRIEAPRADLANMDAPRPEAPREDSKPAAQPRSLYDSLEQEMASLLGRPNKN